MDDEALVMDVTAELIGERRQEWRDGFDSGVHTGVRRTLESNALEQLVFELNLHRSAIGAWDQRERLLAHWKAEAQWWREEHDRVHADYCAFVKDMARRFPK